MTIPTPANNPELLRLTREEMAAFDQLPHDLRELFHGAINLYSAEFTLKMLRQGMPLRDVLAAIRNSEVRAKQTYHQR